MRGRAVQVLVLGLVAAAALAPGALAGKPEFERIDIDESFHDEFLSEACGFEVTTTAVGHVTARSFDRDRGAVEVRTVSVRLTPTAGDRVYRFNDAGADMVRIEPDGTAVLQIIGKLPFDFTGVLKIDLETDEAILEPKHLTGDQVEDACEALSA